jgi:hypothetical protein
MLMLIVTPGCSRVRVDVGAAASGWFAQMFYVGAAASGWFAQMFYVGGHKKVVWNPRI